MTSVLRLFSRRNPPVLRVLIEEDELQIVPTMAPGLANGLQGATRMVVKIHLGVMGDEIDRTSRPYRFTKAVGLLLPLPGLAGFRVAA